ncbi:acyltransferase domain-containing protein [Actinosynnema sp. NPDC023794]
MTTPPVTSRATDVRLLALSASTPEALESATDRVCDRLDALDDAGFAALADELRAEPARSCRRVLVATGPADAARRLRGRDPGRVLTATARPDRAVVWMFSGVGDHYPGLAAGLHRCLPPFREHLDACFSILRRHHGLDLDPVLYPHGVDGVATGDRATDLAAVFDRRGVAEDIHRTEVAQPLMFAVQYALARACESVGLRPSAVLGYSVGEFVAACVAGVFTLPDAVGLVVARARLIADLPPGGMLAAVAPADVVAPHLRDEVVVAALDGPELTILSGPPGPLEDTGDALVAAGITTRRLPTAHAFHSPMMAPVVGPLRAAVAATERARPRAPLLSNTTGSWLGADEAVDPDYWARHVTATIRFADNLAAVWSLRAPVLVEFGPGRTLSRLAAAHPGRPPDSFVLRTLPGAFERTPDRTALLETAGRLWAAGLELRWPPDLT